MSHNAVALNRPLLRLLDGLVYSGSAFAYNYIGPTVLRGPRNFWQFRIFIAEFEPRKLPRNSSFSAEFDVFHSNNYFSRKMTSKYLYYKFVYDDFLFDGDG